MKLSELEQKIRTQLETNFTAAPIAWPNVHFSAQKDAPEGTWVRPTIRMAETDLTELGDGGLGERNGLLYIDVFTRKNTGPVGAQIIDLLEPIYRRQDLDGVIFDEPTSGDMGTDRLDKQLNKHQMRIPFWTFIGDET